MDLRRLFVVLFFVAAGSFAGYGLYLYWSISSVHDDIRNGSGGFIRTL